MKNRDIVTAIKPVADAFEKLGVLYYIGGSLASSAYGVARTTLDVDIASNLKPQHVKSLKQMLESSYYIDEDLIIEAIHRHSSFNIIHLETMLKIDVFIVKNKPYYKEALARRRKDILDQNEPTIEFYIVSAEDIVLFKLDWYKKEECVSENQWKDILGVLKVKRNSLDFDYLKKWALNLDLSDLLERELKKDGLK